MTTLQWKSLLLVSNLVGFKACSSDACSTFGVSCFSCACLGSWVKPEFSKRFWLSCWPRQSPFSPLCQCQPSAQTVRSKEEEHITWFPARLVRNSEGPLESSSPLLIQWASRFTLLASAKRSVICLRNILISRLSMEVSMIFESLVLSRLLSWAQSLPLEWNGRPR